ncbi:MAG: hypothetical protein J6P16_03235 [Eubacterium sp.]|nr:hypothetical protein [Eubacterium sp.]
MEEETLHRDKNIIVCSECSGIMRYRSRGVYVCESCGHEALDDFGKVNAFLEKRGPSNVFEIAEGTGLERKRVSALLKEGRLQVAESSSVALVCARCGMPIRFGEYCSSCAEKMRNLDERNSKKGVYNALNDIKQGADGKMRFIDDK